MNEKWHIPQNIMLCVRDETFQNTGAIRNKELPSGNRLPLVDKALRAKVATAKSDLGLVTNALPLTNAVALFRLSHIVVIINEAIVQDECYLIIPLLHLQCYDTFIAVLVL